MPRLNKDELGLWLFEEAPEEYRRLSGSGGGEDWVLYCPDRLLDELRLISLIDSSAFDKGCAPEEHDVDGGVVYIGTHA